MNAASRAFQRIRNRSARIRGVVSVSVALLGMLLCGVEIMSGYNVPDSAASIVFLAMLFAFLALFAAAPACGATGVVICWFTGYAVPFTTPSMVIIIGLAMTVVLGMVCLPEAIGVALGPLVASAVTTAVDPHGHPDSMANSLLLSASILVLSLLGYVIRRRQDDAARAAQLERRRYHDGIIADLHDCVCNDLSVALAQLSELDGQALAQVADARDAVARALARTRTVLDMLHDEPDDTLQGTGRSERRAIDVRALCLEHRRRIGTMGFEGVIIGLDSGPLSGTRTIDAARAALITGFIREIFNNIARHADRTRGYAMTVGVRGGTLRIDVADTPLRVAPSGGARRDERHGTGLAFYRSRFAAFGGDITVIDDPDAWTMRASIPLSD